MGRGTNSTEKPLKTASASFKRLSLTDVIRERKEKLRQKPETVTASPPETQPLTNPKLEATLIALDDATDEKNLAELVEHCTLLSADLSEDEKIQLREKIKASKKRLSPAKKERIVHGFFEAERKIKETGAVLEKRSKYRFRVV